MGPVFCFLLIRIRNGLIIDDPWRLIVDVDSVLGSLHRVDVNSVTDISEIYATSIIRVEVNRMSESIYLPSSTPTGDEWGLVLSPWVKISALRPYVLTLFMVLLRLSSQLSG